MSVNDAPPNEQKPLPGDRPMKAILGRPRAIPGETKEEAARRLSRELFGKLKPSGPTAERPPTTSPK